jgi:hypothetical protein
MARVAFLVGQFVGPIRVLPCWAADNGVPTRSLLPQILTPAEKIFFPKAIAKSLSRRRFVAYLNREPAHTDPQSMV